ncbi:HD domain-containing protein [Pseudobutyrivibrio sp. OR37]|uniref:HD domain-containing protein n=1 Tax=Pseudobutyrivibrio sp. OR37 TaxID=1798186 RepID=UPI0008EE00D4|nr:HD domain-containing protein [Pseudobutyrivibrio sp. OR37]SFH70980.1 HD domain-containing protein [Pseudobutyrivibrio sp. OR37]
MPDSKYIGISEDRLHHMLGVARKAYKIALERGHNKTFATKMFVIGWNHDIGYEFSKYQEEHSMVSAAILSNAFYDEGQDLGKNGGSTINAIYSHGLYTEEKTEEWIILNQADMQVDII